MIRWDFYKFKSSLEKQISFHKQILPWCCSNVAILNYHIGSNIPNILGIVDDNESRIVKLPSLDIETYV